MCWMFGLNDLDVFDVLYVLDDLETAKVCSEKISFIELHCHNVKLIFHSPYIWADMLWSYKWVGCFGWDWVGWNLCVGLLYEHRFAVLIMKATNIT